MASINFLFWNIKKNKNCLLALADLVQQYATDVVLLAECPFDDATVIAALGTRFQWAQHTNNQLKFFSTLSAPAFAITNAQFDEHLVLASLRINKHRLLLVGVHLPSKWPKADDDAQIEWAEEYRTLITEQEGLISNKTYIFGDFNLNPYDAGMTHRTRGFTTISSQRLAVYHRKRKIGRRVKVPRRYFYNPMWAFLGDISPGTGLKKVPGTFSWSPKNPTDTHWNCLDGLLVSPEGLIHFDDASLQILTESIDPATSMRSHLLFEKTVNRKYSDHLPIRFTLTDL